VDSLSALTRVFRDNQDPVFAAWQKAYMRNRFPFFGLRQPIRKRLQKPFLFPKEEVLHVFGLDEREFQYTAIDLFIHHGVERRDLQLLEQLITSKSWWDTVDVIATNPAGHFFKKFPSLIGETENWLVSPNLWLRRSALLFQLRYKEHTDASRLFRYCTEAKKEKDLFIQRAIAWALREYSKTNSGEVLAFVQSNAFSPLIQREVLGPQKIFQKKARQDE
jgi:3-methyladenine DNA glycosylase AlkD